MKTINATAMIGLFLLLGTSETNAQRRTEVQLLSRQERVQDLMNILEIVRYKNNVNYTDIYDRSVLMYASSRGYTIACRILLRREADPYFKDKDGKSAMDYAGNPDIKTCLNEPATTTVFSRSK
jgi:ankyrin repeat protein